MRVQAAVEANSDLSQIFTKFGTCCNLQEAFALKDAMPMQDTKLQKLIGKMQSCRYMVDKVIMLHREIHSLADLIEVLDTCFVWEEYKEIYSQLHPEVLAALGHFLRQRWDNVQQPPERTQALL